MRRKFTLLFFIFLVFAILGISITLPSEAKIRDKILKKTPIGTKFENVLDFCKRRNLKCKSSKNAGYLDRNNKKVVGVQSIWGILEEKKTTPLTIRVVEVYWGFDINGILLDIMVVKTVDAP